MPRMPPDNLVNALNAKLGLTPGQDGAALYYPQNGTIGLKGSYLVDHQDGWEQVQRTPERPGRSPYSVPGLMAGGMGTPEPSDTFQQVQDNLSDAAMGDPDALLRDAHLRMLKGGR